MEIRYYNSQVQQFVESLSERTRGKFLEVTDLLEQCGHKLGLPFSKHLGGHLYELRLSSAEEVRLFYAFRDQCVVLLHGFVKQSQKIPRRELKIARQRLKQMDAV